MVLGAGAGAAVGGVTARLYDAGIDNDRLAEIGEALHSGCSAVIVILKEIEAELIFACPLIWFGCRLVLVRLQVFL